MGGEGHGPAEHPGEQADGQAPAGDAHEGDREAGPEYDAAQRAHGGWWAGVVAFSQRVADIHCASALPSMCVMLSFCVWSVVVLVVVGIVAPCRPMCDR